MQSVHGGGNSGAHPNTTTLRRGLLQSEIPWGAEFATRSHQEDTEISRGA